MRGGGIYFSVAWESGIKTLESRSLLTRCTVDKRSSTETSCTRRMLFPQKLWRKNACMHDNSFAQVHFHGFKLARKSRPQFPRHLGRVSVAEKSAPFYMGILWLISTLKCHCTEQTKQLTLIFSTFTASCGLGKLIS